MLFFFWGRVVEVDLKCWFSVFPGKGIPLARGPWLGVCGCQWGVCQPVLQPGPLLVPSRDTCITWTLLLPPSQCSVSDFFFLTLVPWKLPSRLEERRHLGCWFSSLLPACPLLPLPLFGPSCLCTHRILWWCTCVDVSPRWLLFLVKKLVFILRLKQSRGCRYYLPK